MHDDDDDDDDDDDEISKILESDCDIKEENYNTDVLENRHICLLRRYKPLV
jgi:hypothetical protein